MTSDRLTAEMSESASRPRTASPPDSFLSRARTAEASRTALLTRGLFLPLGDQLIDQADPLRYEAGDEGLGLGDGLIDRPDADAGAVVIGDDLVARGDGAP